MRPLWIAVCVWLPTTVAGAATHPQVSRLFESTVEVRVDNTGVLLKEGQLAGPWTFMGTASDSAGRKWAVFEDFTTIRGGLVMVDADGNSIEFPKSAESTHAAPETLYLGHTYDEVIESAHDLLGAEILAQPGDPSYDEVASCFPPIVRMDTHTFVGTRDSPDKVGVTYGGRTANFDPVIYEHSIDGVRAAGNVIHGLLGGWLPVLRFVYPEASGDWTEMVLFAPGRTDDGNSTMQPVWYRVGRVEGGRLMSVRYFDTYLPSPPRTGPLEPAPFYTELLTLRSNLESSLAGGIQLSLPDQRLENLSRHSIVRALITRIGSFPKYGVLDRNYGGAEHDGFQDTFNVDVTAMLEWGLFDLARDYIDNYLTHFVRDDGSILYRGPETGQYGRMLTVVAEYFSLTHDSQLLMKHRKRIDAIAHLLLSLREIAKKLPAEDPAHGMIAGWCEADSCLERDPARYVLPYFSNSTEAVRGFRDLGRVWEKIGRSAGQEALVSRGAALVREARELEADLHTAITRSMLRNTSPVCLPAIAGASEPFDVAVARDVHDPQFRAYRAYMEMLFSGCLRREEAATIIRYREAHHDTVLGVPVAYSNDTHELAGFLSYGHAYGLLQHDFIREFLLELYSLSAHQYTRGTWTAPETRCIEPGKTTAPYCVPAQLSVPLLVRWMLAFEEPNSETLWLCKATPRDWLADGSRIAASAIPTRWGRISVRVVSHIASGRIDASLDLPESGEGHKTVLRLRAPDSKRIAHVQVGGKTWSDFDSDAGTITLPASVSGHVSLTVMYQ